MKLDEALQLLLQEENKDIGKRFGSLIVMKRIVKKISNRSRVFYECLCDCGNVCLKRYECINNISTCPICKSIYSKGEMLIATYLKSNNIIYEPQKIFQNCRYKRSLKFDFYLPNYNICIEYQGEQHYKIVDFGSKNIIKTKKQFCNTINRDNIKRNFCKENNIILFEIPYWYKKNIKYLLDKLLFT